MRFLHCADIHLGAQQHPSLYQQEALPALFRVAREKGVDFILCVGDIFDRPNPDQKVKDYLLKILLDNSDIRVAFTVGNHDYTTKAKDYHCLRYLSILSNKLDNIFVYEPGTYSNLFDFGSIYVLDSLSKNIVIDKNLHAPLILAYHGVPDGFYIENFSVSESCSTSIKNILKNSGASYLALGDIHKNIQLTKRCWYPGALVQKTYACESGLLVVNIDSKNNIITENLSLELPKRYNLLITYNPKEDNERDVVDFVRDKVREGQLVRVCFNLPLTTWASVDKNFIREALKDYVLELKLDNVPVQEIKQRESFEKILKAKTIEEELSVLVKEDSFGLDPDKLIKKCNSYLKKQC